MDLQQQVLRTDVGGMPLEWIGYQDAVRLIALGQVSYSLGRTLYRIHGGINALSGVQSFIDVNAIVASHGTHPHSHLFSDSYTPPLSNKALFRRDQSLCLYCGVQFSGALLSRDHVKPLSQGGADIWSNVVTACKRCNNHKAGRTPEQEICAQLFTMLNLLETNRSAKVIALLDKRVERINNILFADKVFDLSSRYFEWLQIRF